MTLDSNILIAYLAGESKVVQTLSEWRREGRPLFLPAVVECEVLSFREWTHEECRAIEEFLEENFTPIPFDRTVARMAAEIRRGFGIRLPDAAIAATALFTHTPVVTRNERDFKRIASLPIVAI